jgi:hypothetical protein
MCVVALNAGSGPTPADQPAADVGVPDGSPNMIEFVEESLAGELLANGDDRLAAIYSNSGNLADPFVVTRPGGGCSGRDVSETQTGLGLQANGFNCLATTPNTVADDFVVPDGQTWSIDQVVFYMYRTNSTTPSISSVEVRLQAQNPLGNFVPSLTAYSPSVTMSGVHKAFDYDLGSCSYRLQQCIVTLDTPYVAAAGTHYLIWQASGSGSASGPWVPPVVVSGAVQKPGANAMQAMNSGGGIFNYLFDPGSGHPQQDLVFVLRGSISNDWAVGDLNCDGTYGAQSFGDINPFVLYLSNFASWQATYPNCDPRVGDINGDGTYGPNSFGDINPFVTLLSGG